MTMLTFPNQPKQFFLDRVKRHREADQLIQGSGWLEESQSGCAVGCTLECYDHTKYPEILGVPEELARVQDSIFEGLPQTEALLFPEQFLSAIPDKADLSLVWARFTLALLSGDENGVILLVKDEEWKRQRDAIEGMILLYREWVDTGIKPSDDRFEARAAWAAEAARAAEAAWAAWAAEAARAAEAAWAARAARAAWAAEAAEAARAAWAAEAARAARAARAAWAAEAAGAAANEKFWKFARDALLKLLAEAPVSA